MVSFPAEFPFVRSNPQPAPVPTDEEREKQWPSGDSTEMRSPAPDPDVAETVAPAVGPVEHAVASPAVAKPPAAVPLAPVPVAPVPMAPVPSRLIERRKAKRDPMSAGALVKLDAFHGPPTRVAVTDISVAGVRFRSAQPMDAGDKAQIRLEVGPLRWTTRLRIVHCESDPDGLNTIGCAFLRTELLRPWPATAA